MKCLIHLRKINRLLIELSITKKKETNIFA